MILVSFFWLMHCRWTFRGRHRLGHDCWQGVEPVGKWQRICSSFPRAKGPSTVYECMPCLGFIRGKEYGGKYHQTHERYQVSTADDCHHHQEPPGRKAWSDKSDSSLPCFRGSLLRQKARSFEKWFLWQRAWLQGCWLRPDFWFEPMMLMWIIATNIFRFH